ncbi:LOW QUALITY PROTEIN: hemicentin-2 [Nilaparvata lugens]|uniref:LOW QUALITY PROTEIN: hemicentin-2 n=1 Tax=Nilaparvata lugens TaxID=108931 RepID=UPI00193D0A11|nr:LOW QUALITY PROTEIN: hemicentin-2 [Nilaparvata lugens]
MSRCCVIGLTVFIAITTCSDQENNDIGIIDTYDDKVPISDTRAVAGGVAKIPCDVATQLKDDRVHLVLWYKEGEKGMGVRIPLTPIYSFDGRDGAEDEAAQHWTDTASLGSRAFFNVKESPAKLTIDGVKDKDGGVYRCRVDFRKSPTRNSRVNLTVIIPPERLSVVDENGDHIQHYILGPYSEGASLDLACIATGGRPTPRVTWWQENALLDDTWELMSERRVRNVLRVEKLQRRHLHAVFTCQASNNDLVAPISSAVTLDLNLNPLWVKILGENRPVSANHSQEVRCEVAGARPAPHIRWWKGSFLLYNATQETSSDGNRTTSTLHYIPSMEDFGEKLICKATSPFLKEPFQQDSWTLNVRHVPEITLEVGGGTNLSAIKEGDDVHLECTIRANPWVYRVAWEHNGKTLYSNVSDGVQVNNQSLLIRNVTRSHAGVYTCIASNQEGDGQSNQLLLDVKFKPVCRPGQQTVLGAARLEKTEIACEVEANPVAVNFTWEIHPGAGVNGSVGPGAGKSRDKVEDKVEFDVEKTRSTAVVTPVTTADFGEFSCWATNVIGRQLEPCVYKLIPAGRPEAVSNCTVLNQTEDLVVVGCSAGFDGGLGQAFQLELYDGAQLLRNVSSAHALPHFTLQPLPAADSRRLQLRVYAFNHKGRSPYVTLQLLNSNHAERRTAAVTVQFMPLIGAVLGIVGALVLIVVAVALAIYLKSRESAAPASKRSTPSLDSLEKNPDIIPQCNEYQTSAEKDVDKLLSCPETTKPKSPFFAEKNLEVIQTESILPHTSFIHADSSSALHILHQTDDPGQEFMTLGPWRHPHLTTSATPSPATSTRF